MLTNAEDSIQVQDDIEPFHGWPRQITRKRRTGFLATTRQTNEQPVTIEN
jgi:hypothetical protein